MIRSWEWFCHNQIEMDRLLLLLSYLVKKRTLSICQGGNYPLQVRLSCNLPLFNCLSIGANSAEVRNYIQSRWIDTCICLECTERWLCFLNIYSTSDVCDMYTMYTITATEIYCYHYPATVQNIYKKRSVI